MKELHYLFEGINFSVSAVTDLPLAVWLEMASKQYFAELGESDREAKLTAIYNQCLELKKANQPKHEPANNEAVPDNENLPVTRRSRANARRTVQPNEEEAGDTIKE